MARDKQRPVSEPGHFDNQTVTHHPAYGMVTVNRTHTNGTTLFASDINHNELITLAFFQGEECETDGDMRQSRRSNRPLLEVSLSPAQWAAMITSFGLGEGVPCTLNYIRDGKIVGLPSIEKVESTRERFDRQIQEAAAREMAKIQEKMDALAGLVAKGKAGKKELAEVYSGLAGAMNNLPGNLSFSTTLMQEAMDHIVASGKAELEAVALGVATRLGMKEMSRLAEIEDKRDEVED